MAVVALAVVGLGVWRGEAVYWWVMTERSLYERGPGEEASGLGTSVSFRFPNAWKRRYGWNSVNRWTGRYYGPFIHWHEESGFKATEGIVRRNMIYVTTWNPDGTEGRQEWRRGREKSEYRESPPWLWGVTDQAAPSAPAWILDDAKWQAALDAQK